MRNLYRKRTVKTCLNCGMDQRECTAIDLDPGGPYCCESCDHPTYVPVESTKLERKLQCALNRISKLIPSVHRLQVLDRIAMELDAEAEKAGRVPTLGADAEALAADALYLRRLEYDLTSMREAKASIQPKKEKTMKAASKYDPVNWPRGERP